MYKELMTINRLLKDFAKQKEEQKADATLKDTLSRMRRAMRKNPDIAPPLMSSAGELDTSGDAHGPKMAPQGDTGDDDTIDAVQVTLHAPGDVHPSVGQTGHGIKESPPKKVRVKNLRGKSIIARSIAVGGIGITCALENCGKDQPAAFTDAGIVYINVDHPLYRKQTGRGGEMLGFYLTYLLSQQVALLLSEGDARKIFDTQTRLLADSW